MEGIYKEKLSVGFGHLVVTKKDYYIQLEFSIDDMRYNKDYLTINKDKIDTYIEAFRENWIKYLELKKRKRRLKRGYCVVGLLGMEIYFDKYIEGVCFHRLLKNIETEDEMKEMINSFLWAKEYGHKYMKVLNENYSQSYPSQEDIIKKLESLNSKYFDHLLKRQLENYNILQVKESICYGKKFEYPYHGNGFLFTTKSKNSDTGSVKLVYENPNHSLSTIIFIVFEKDYEKAVNSIILYLGKDYYSDKRSKISEKLNLESIMRIYTVNHGYIGSQSDYRQWYRNS